MGAGELPSLSQTLIRHGRPPDTACVVIENGTLPNQRVLATTLAGLAALAREHAIHAPAIAIIGEVAAHAALAERCRRDATETGAITRAA